MTCWAGVGLWAIATSLGVAAHGAERSAAIRVRLRIADEAPAGTSESVRDVLAILREGKDLDGLVEASPEGETDLMLVVTNRFTGMPRPSGEPLSPNNAYTLQAIVIDGRKAVPTQGRGVLWRQAALALLKAVGLYAREHEHALLRRRSDWPAVGFDFEPLTKEHEKELGAKGGAVIVTEVAASGPAARAGLRAGDAVAKVAGHKVENAGDLARALYEAPRGAALMLEVSRAGARQPISFSVP